MDWKLLRFELFQALDSLDVYEIYLIEQDSNILTVCFILDNVENLRPLTRMRIIDSLIERNCPDIYRAYVFLYEVWAKKDWGKQLVGKMIAKRMMTTLR